MLEILHINLSHFVACEGTKIKVYLHFFDDELLISIFQPSSCL
jgi:hypothetical protein